jgi:hypothetical protein
MRTLKDSANIDICHIVDLLYQTNGVGPVTRVVLPSIIHLTYKVFVALDIFCKVFADSCVENRYLRGSIEAVFFLGFGAKDRVQLVEFLEPVI